MQQLHCFDQKSTIGDDYYDGDDDEDFNRFDQKIYLSVWDILREQQTMRQLKMALFGTACPSNMDFMTTVKAIL